MRARAESSLIQYVFLFLPRILSGTASGQIPAPAGFTAATFPVPPIKHRSRWEQRPCSLFGQRVETVTEETALGDACPFPASLASITCGDRVTVPAVGVEMRLSSN